MRLELALRRFGRRRVGHVFIMGLMAAVGLPGGAEGKTPGQRYCFLGVCHRVLTLEETRAQIGRTQVLHASFYYEAGRDRFNPSNITSSGAYFQASRPDNAASPVLPNGTKLLVWHPITKQAVVVRIDNAGPYWGRRMLDLSRAAAERLGMVKNGVGTVMTRVLEAPTVQEATYRRGRTYPPVPGFLGAFPNIDLAHWSAARAMDRPIPFDQPAPIEIAADDLMPPPELGSYAVAAVSAPVMLAAPAPVARPAVPVRVASAPAAKPAPKAVKIVEVKAAPSAKPAANAKVAAKETKGGSGKLAAQQVVAAGGRVTPVNQAARVPVAAAPRRTPAPIRVAARSETAAETPVPPPTSEDTRWTYRALTLPRDY